MARSRNCRARWPTARYQRWSWRRRISAGWNRTRNLNAFLDVRPEVTLAQAAAADARLARGRDATPLTGVPIAHKDIFVTKDFFSTASSKILRGYRSPFDATVVDNLAQAGMVTVGKTNCDEFAMGSSNENSAFGNVLNPWDHGAVPGGSSGGSSAAVAARLVPVATATDTGGSIREPAAFTGVTGTKPTYGRPSRWGMIAFASSLDTAGLMTRSAEDAALVFNSMLGFDPKDSTSANRPREDYTRHLNLNVKELRIGVPKEFFGQLLQPDVEAAVREALAEYQRLGATLVDISLPNAELGIPVYYVVAPAEASSNLSRFDGVRYGHRAAQYSRPHRHDQKVPLRGIRRGAEAPHSGRHLRAVARLLRRLLHQSAKSAPDYCRRIQPCVLPL